VHQLNARGYAVVFGIGAAGVIFWRWRKGAKSSKPQTPGTIETPNSKLQQDDSHTSRRAEDCAPYPWMANWGKLRRRFRRGFPLGFAVLGGILHAPSNYDGLAYRAPRVLHWLAEGKWNWIHTEFHRLNTRATAYEWITAPMFALGRTGRLSFLIDGISFLLLPGLIYAVFIRIGMARRVAWHWMWLLPTGYCYLLQAGSIGNDLFGAVFPLAALFFALRARESQAPRDVWLSVLAAAEMTAGKSSNLPLLLPWLAAMAPVSGLLRMRGHLMTTALIGLVAAVCSFLPTAALNWKYGGDWTGLKAEKAVMGPGGIRNTTLKLAWNCIVLPLENLTPPVFPMARQWNSKVVTLIPEGLKQRLEVIFEPSQAHLALEELAVEESAGVGFGVTALMLAGLVAGIRRSPDLRTREVRGRIWNSRAGRGRVILICGLIAFAVFMAKSGWATAARLVTPYYAIVIPCCLISKGQVSAVRQRWWKRCAAGVFLLAAVAVVLSPARPLWPAQTLLQRLDARLPGNRLIARARTVYQVYSQRPRAFAPVLEVLPRGVSTLGMVTFDDPEASLWHPFGARRIEHVTASDSREDLKRKGIEYVLVNPDKVSVFFQRTLIEWLHEMRGEVVAVIPMRLRAGGEMVEWRLVRIGNTGAEERTDPEP